MWLALHGVFSVKEEDSRSERESVCVCVVVEEGVRGEEAGLVGCFDGEQAVGLAGVGMD